MYMSVYVYYVCVYIYIYIQVLPRIAYLNFPFHLGLVSMATSDWSLGPAGPATMSTKEASQMEVS